MEKMTDRAKQKRAAYMREYRRLHPDKIREINRRYWERLARKEAEAGAEGKTDVTKS